MHYSYGMRGIDNGWTKEEIIEALHVESEHELAKEFKYIEVLSFKPRDESERRVYFANYKTHEGESAWAEISAENGTKTTRPAPSFPAAVNCFIEFSEYMDKIRR